MNTTMENKSDVYIYRVYFENNREARMMDIQEIIELVKKTKKFILNREMVSDVKEKGIADYVTQVDITVQNFLKEELFILAPDIQFLGEETGLQNMKADSFWILDPVDGTTNLMHDYQHSVVSLADRKSTRLNSSHR